MLSIRTQDKMSLVPYDKTISIISDNAKVVYEQNEDYTIALSNKRIIVCGKRFLGAYETHERALEVLDEIQKHVVGKLLIANEALIEKKLHYIKEGLIMPKGMFSAKEEFIEQLPLVYQMPKE